jgi:hypothetical protein
MRHSEADSTQQHRHRVRAVPQRLKMPRPIATLPCAPGLIAPQLNTCEMIGSGFIMLGKVVLHCHNI